MYKDVYCSTALGIGGAHRRGAPNWNDTIKVQCQNCRKRKEERQ